MSDLDFKGLADRLLADIRNVVPRWLPNIRLVGSELTCGSLQGEPGNSLKINVNTGLWKDFSNGVSGGDLITLYAKMRGIRNSEAYKELIADMPVVMSAPVQQPQPLRPAPVLTAPPDATPAPSMEHSKYGSPSASWCYRNPDAAPMFYVARYDTSEGKQIVPWSWNGSEWVAKAWPAPRPLYGLELLRTDRPCLIVEGERCADAARLIVGDKYSVITWPNGALAVNKAEWQPVHGLKILIWPDQDPAGVLAALAIAKTLSKHCPEVKIITVEADKNTGWDAADALSDSWDWQKFLFWAKPRAELYQAEPVQPPPAPPATDTPPPPDVPVIIEYPETVEDLSAAALWDSLGVAVNGRGQPHCNINSIFTVIKNLPGLAGLVWFDEFHQRYFTRWPHSAPPTDATGPVREWTDHDDITFTRFIQQTIAMHGISDQIVSKAINDYAMQHRTNEPRDWLNSLEWDGTERITHFLTACMGTEDSEYTRAASSNFWVGLAARIHRPGCQLDNMLVLEGPQGIGKTRALRLLGGPWYAEAKESVTSKDFFLLLTGKLIIEIAELDSFSRAEVTRIKQVITCPTDSYRAPYERRTSDHPRACVFIGTTNEDTYLRDQTGARRFWPIRCGTIQYDFISQHRAQFFAEASHKFKSGAQWYIMPAATADEQEHRRQGDEWEYIINNYLSAPGQLFLDEITVEKIATECLEIDKSDLDKNTQMRIASILRYLHWTRKLVYAGGEKRARIWIRPVKN